MRSPQLVRFDADSAGAADSFPAVAVEGNGFLSLLDQRLIELVEHLEKGGVGVHVGDLVVHEAAGAGGVRLAPDAQFVRAGSLGVRHL
jgi:hypothetical protein